MIADSVKVNVRDFESHNSDSHSLTRNRFLDSFRHPFGKSGKTHISLIVQIENIIDLSFGNNQSMTFGNGTDV